MDREIERERQREREGDRERERETERAVQSEIPAVCYRGTSLHSAQMFCRRPAA